MKYLGLMALMALLVLSACGGSAHYEDHTPTVPTQPPVATLDAFYSAVLAIIGDGGESTAEPQAIDSIAATAPQDAEPVVFK